MAHIGVVSLTVRVYAPPLENMLVAGRKVSAKPAELHAFTAPRPETEDGTVQIECLKMGADGLSAPIKLSLDARADTHMVGFYVFYDTQTDEGQPTMHLEGASLYSLARLTGVAAPADAPKREWLPLNMTLNDDVDGDAPTLITMCVLDVKLPENMPKGDNAPLRRIPEWPSLSAMSGQRAAVPSGLPKDRGAGYARSSTIVPALRTTIETYRRAFDGDGSFSNSTLLALLRASIWRLPTNWLGVPGYVFAAWRPRAPMDDDVLLALVDASMRRGGLSRAQLADEPLDSDVWYTLLADACSYLSTSLPYLDDYVTNGRQRGVEVEQFFNPLITRGGDCEDFALLAMIVFDALRRTTSDDAVLVALRKLTDEFCFATVVGSATTGSAAQAARNGDVRSPSDILGETGHAYAALLSRRWLAKWIVLDAPAAAPVAGKMRSATCEGTTWIHPMVCTDDARTRQRSAQSPPGMRRQFVCLDPRGVRFYRQVTLINVVDFERPGHFMPFGLRDNHSRVNHAALIDLLQCKDHVALRPLGTPNADTLTQFMTVVRYMYPPRAPWRTKSHADLATRVMARLRTALSAGAAGKVFEWSGPNDTVRSALGALEADAFMLDPDASQASEATVTARVKQVTDAVLRHAREVKASIILVRVVAIIDGVVNAQFGFANDADAKVSARPLPRGWTTAGQSMRQR